MLTLLPFQSTINPAYFIVEGKALVVVKGASQEALGYFLQMRTSLLVL